MARAKVVEVDYPTFLDLLRGTKSAGKTVGLHEIDRWGSYLEERGINESMAMAIARQRLESVSAIIIDAGGDSDGLYLYSEPEEICLRVVSI